MDGVEVTKVSFDEQTVSYGALLDEWRGQHDPSRAWANAKFAQVVFGGRTQCQVAAARLGRPLEGAVRKLGAFTPAPDKDQLYNLKRLKQPDLLLAPPGQAGQLTRERLTRLNHAEPPLASRCLS